MPKNSLLNNAKSAKQDEFYTSLTDIEKEMRWYLTAFRGKTIYCNCDDADSNFYLFFKAQFIRLGLKKLICTHFSSVEPSYMITYDGEEKREVLRCNGDFRSDECVELLKQSDVVVTNPPFSLFREYISQLFEYQKKFLIIGNVNAITYKEVFPHILANELWLGCSIHSGDREFRVPDEYEVRTSNSRVDENGTKYVRVAGVRWYTNLDHMQRHEPLILVKQYHSDKYHMYDNVEVLNVDKVADIPKDYLGVIGVPITFLDKFCPDQFEIVGKADAGNADYDLFKPKINGVAKFKRILIRPKH